MAWRWSPAAIRAAGAKLSPHVEMISKVGAPGTSPRLAAANRVAAMMLDAAIVAQLARDPKILEESFVSVLANAAALFETSKAAAEARAAGAVSPRMQEWVGRLVALKNEARDAVLATQAEERERTRGQTDG